MPVQLFPILAVFNDEAECFFEVELKLLDENGTQIAGDEPFAVSPLPPAAQVSLCLLRCGCELRLSCFLQASPSLNLHLSLQIGLPFDLCPFQLA